ncbi:MAG: segregation ATPase FtsK/SpoIIIE, family, partial [Actinomycetota bacterium]
MADGVWDRPRAGWTCAECGFTFDATDPATVADSIARAGKRLRAPLTRGLPNEDLLAVLRTRPEPDRWSALEYACHVRDALALNVDRFAAIAADDEPPEFVALDPDAAVLERNYNGQD